MEYLLTTAYIAAPLVLAIIAVLFFGAIIQWGHSKDVGLVPYIFYPVFLGGALTVLFSGRNLYLPETFIDPELTKNTLTIWTSRAISIFILLAAGERIAKRLIGSDSKNKGLVILMSAFLFYFTTNILSAALFSTHPSFSHVYFYTVLAGSAALLMNLPEGESAIRSARNVLITLLLLSSVCIIWRPELVMSRDYQGLIPGLRLRYAGLSNHANALGPLVVVFLICLWSKPFEGLWLTRLGWIVGVSSLLLTQSKTSWIAFILCSTCLLAYRFPDKLNFGGSPSKRPIVPIVLIIVVMVIATTSAINVMFGSAQETTSSFLSSRTGGELMTLTGRDQIWEIAVEEWRANPLFGYGLTIWDEAFRMRVGLPAAVHAHNQFFQSLSSAGLIGAIGLVIYALTLIVFSLKASKASQGLSLALLLLLLARSFSEVPLTLIGYGTEQLTHLLLLMVIAAYYSPKAPKQLLVEPFPISKMTLN